MSNLDLVIAYYDACNAANVDALSACLTHEMTHYFLAPNPGSAAVRGGQNVAKHFAAVQTSVDGRWVVDHYVGNADEAIIEWTLFWTSPKTGERVGTRGAEAYRFEGGKIAEVRAYYRQRHETSELDEFDYAARGYSFVGQEWSAIHKP